MITIKRKIAVESDLSNISAYLAGKGYDVKEFQHNQESPELFRNVDAIVASGMDQNYLGMHDIKTPAIVINASGLTPREIEEQLEIRI